MVRVKKTRRNNAVDPLRLLARHLFAVFTVATVFCCVSVYYFFLNVEVSLNHCGVVRVCERSRDKRIDSDEERRIFMFRACRDTPLRRKG